MSCQNARCFLALNLEKMHGERDRFETWERYLTLPHFKIMIGKKLRRRTMRI